MTPNLVAIAGPLRGETVSLSEDPLTIGREPSNRLHLNDLSLSRQHCVLGLQDGHATLTDLQSLNGTFVNGVPIKERRLEHGDQLTIGDSTFLFFDTNTSAGTSSAVELNDVVVRQTAMLRPEDVLYLQSDQTLDGFPQLRRHGRDLSVLLRVNAALGSIRNFGELQRTLVDLVFAAAPVDCVAIVIAENAGADFTSVYGRGRNPDARVQVSRTVVRQVLADGVAVLCNDPGETSALRAAESIIGSATRSFICAPLKGSTRIHGALLVASNLPTVRLDEGHLELIVGITTVAAIALENIQHIERLERETRELRADLAVHHSMVGESAPMRKINQVIAKAAPSESTVLILGESGTGKELAARAIHMNSPRAHRPFVAITAAVLSETLLESELFGHEKGAFTGAIAQKKGQLELADGGTVFLDEIGDLAPALQVKILRALQEREFTRVGGTRPIKIDVRFIAATNRDLEAAVKDGTFRQDLYYRLNVVVLSMPALRERRDDIPLLAAFFLTRFSAKCKRRVVGFSEEARGVLLRYDWPGNVRELENTIERAVVLGAADRITVDDLPERVLEQDAHNSDLHRGYQHAVQNAKRQIVTAALAGAAGNHAEAARQLGLHPNNLHRLIPNLNLKGGIGTDRGDETLF